MSHQNQRLENLNYANSSYMYGATTAKIFGSHAVTRKVHLVQLGVVGQVLEKDEEIAELQKRLTVLIRLVETYQDTLPVSFS